MATSQSLKTCTAFSVDHCIATGLIKEVALKVKALLDVTPEMPVLFFDDEFGTEFDLNLRGTVEQVETRLDEQFPAPVIEDKIEVQAAVVRGRPRLDVVAREVTLQPRHWEWIKSRPGSASSVLRSLVDEARRKNADSDKRKKAQKAVFLFISAIAGNNINFEEAVRALFACDQQRFEMLIKTWPTDIQVHANRLAESAFLSSS